MLLTKWRHWVGSRREARGPTIPGGTDVCVKNPSEVSENSDRNALNLWTHRMFPTSPHRNPPVDRPHEVTPSPSGTGPAKWRPEGGQWKGCIVGGAKGGRGGRGDLPVAVHEAEPLVPLGLEPRPHLRGAHSTGMGRWGGGRRSIDERMGEVGALTEEGGVKGGAHHGVVVREGGEGLQPRVGLAGVRRHRLPDTGTKASFALVFF